MASQCIASVCCLFLLYLIILVGQFDWKAQRENIFQLVPLFEQFFASIHMLLEFDQFKSNLNDRKNYRKSAKRKPSTEILDDNCIILCKNIQMARHLVIRLSLHKKSAQFYKSIIFTII